MRRLIVASGFLSLAFAAQANDAALELSLNNKALVSVATPAMKRSEAPFTAAHDPLPQLLMAEEQDRRTTRGTCESAPGICASTRPTAAWFTAARRKYMPQFDGLTPESVSLRGSRITFKYSFK
jgi:hypothetical protein